MAVVEDEIIRNPGHKQTPASTPTIIREEDWRNVGGVSMEVVECDTAKYIPHMDNLPRWASNHFKPS